VDEIWSRYSRPDVPVCTPNGLNFFDESREDGSGSPWRKGDAYQARTRACRKPHGINARLALALKPKDRRDEAQLPSSAGGGKSTSTYPIFESLSTKCVGVESR
jgi:hypothetical protein